MRAAWAAALGALLSGCQMVGTETQYGVASNDMTFGELNVVLDDGGDSPIQGVPFLVVGQGTLPEQYGDDISYQRVSLEAGGMVSYYQSEAIGTPFEPELVGGGGVQMNLGENWSIDFGARARQPVGNGYRHDEPEHAPDGTQAEFFFGVRKDF